MRESTMLELKESMQGDLMRRNELGKKSPGVLLERGEERLYI